MQLKAEPVYSVIDIGTNTCLLLIGSLKGKSLKTLFEAQETPRLGKDLYKSGKISRKNFIKFSGIIKKYISVSGKFHAQGIFAFGTSALRDAKNSKEFVKYIESETGVRIKIISGKEEAKYSYEGAVFDLKPDNKYTVIDIGGGSTEICSLKTGKPDYVSLNIGSVRIFEKFFKGNFSDRNLDRAREFISGEIRKQKSDVRGKKLVGVGGTITTLSAIKNNLKDFKKEKIHKDTITLIQTKNILGELISMTETDRLRMGSFMKGRSDIIICGILILTEAMSYLNTDKLIVSTNGLRYGLFLHIPDFI